MFERFYIKLRFTAPLVATLPPANEKDALRMAVKRSRRSVELAGD